MIIDGYVADQIKQSQLAHMNEAKTKEGRIVQQLFKYADVKERQAYQQGREDAEEEHKAMCESCIHKVSAEDIKQIRADAIDEFATNLIGEIEAYANAGHNLDVCRWVKNYTEQKNDSN